LPLGGRPFFPEAQQVLEPLRTAFRSSWERWVADAFVLSSYRSVRSAGPTVREILADLGADVILVEPPGGSPARARGPFFRNTTHPNCSLHRHRTGRGQYIELSQAKVSMPFLRAALFDYMANGDVEIGRAIAIGIMRRMASVPVQAEIPGSRLHA
jgi:crotonobetainyl-CoA:carnitine CoA-transferase CaiB-like acyl-CoA transferase